MRNAMDGDGGGSSRFFFSSEVRAWFSTSSASDPLRHHSDIQPYELPNNEADDDLDTDDDNDN